MVAPWQPCRQPAVAKPRQALASGRRFHQSPYNDIQARSIAKTIPMSLRFLLEPIQGEGGVKIPDTD